MAEVKSLRPPDTLVELWGLLDEWMTWLAAREISDTTQEQYESYLLRFLRRTRSTPQAVTEELIDRFLAGVPARGSNRNAYVSALKSFYRFAHRRAHVGRDPTVELMLKDRKYPDPDYLTGRECRAVLGAARRRDRSDRRYWTLVLLFETGSRIGSLAAVEPRDVGTQAGEWIRFRVAKNDRPYAVKMTPAAARAVRGLGELHDPSWKTLIGVHKVTIGNWFRDAARDAGLPEGRVHAHLARHTAATNLYRRTKDPLVTAQFLNHADLSQIPRYARITDERWDDVLRDDLTDGA